MASRRFSAAAVVSFFEGDERCLPEVFCEGSDDDLGTEEHTDLEDETDGDIKVYSFDKTSKQCIAQNVTDERQAPVVLGPMSSSRTEGRNRSEYA